MGILSYELTEVVIGFVVSFFAEFNRPFDDGYPVLILKCFFNAVNAARRMDVLPFKPLKAGLVTTGKELAEGRIEDAFAEKFRRKLAEFGGALIG